MTIRTASRSADELVSNRSDPVLRRAYAAAWRTSRLWTPLSTRTQGDRLGACHHRRRKNRRIVEIAPLFTIHQTVEGASDIRRRFFDRTLAAMPAKPRAIGVGYRCAAICGDPRLGTRCSHGGDRDGTEFAELRHHACISQSVADPPSRSRC
jgi:hypothetical protein